MALQIDLKAGPTFALLPVMEAVIKILLNLMAWFLIIGTALNFSKHPHWFIRAWDFPRLSISIIAAGTAIAYGSLFSDNLWHTLTVLLLIGVVVRQLYMVFPYTPIATKTVKQTLLSPGDCQFKLLISNVLMENEDHEKWLKVVLEADPDLIVAVEINEDWLKAIASLEDDYAHRVYYPLENYYGMVLLSRLEFTQKPEIRFLVQDDVPSIHTSVRLKSGHELRLHALHPRPPEPIYDQDSAPRDAELVLLGKEIQKKERNVPVVVCGDLNDVAWSFTTQLFLRLSKLLDPRMGRGFYNSFNANSKFFRYPLDHVFHSDELKLVELRVLDHVGSDHFPILIALSCEPEARHEQDETKSKPQDHEDAKELLEEQSDRERSGEEHGHVAGRTGDG